MLDIFLQDNDFIIDGSRTLKLIANSECVKQRVYIALKLGYGEFFYNVLEGVPYIEFIKNSISNQNRNTTNIIGIWFMDYIYSVSGVKKVTELEVRLDQNRTAQIKCNIEDDFGQTFQLGVA
ncbi:MAG: hypothetical protein LBJ71_04065 [Holosporaceae bacterium]|jgi:hypothetical protein|nr:hypothetical protein [Holosporaceae bacterium]